MIDTVLAGELRGPLPAPSGDSRYFLYAMLGAGVGVALYSGALVGVWMLSIEKWNPVWSTPLFALPLAVALWRTGRIGIAGALVLIAGTTAAHFLAVFAAAAAYDPAPIFATAAQRAAYAAREQISAFASGAAGGAAGAALSFALIATFAPGLRDRRRLGEYVFATLMLAALGAIALGGLLPRSGVDSKLDIVFLLYVPWQAVFAFAIVHAFKDHQAVR